MLIDCTLPGDFSYVLVQYLCTDKTTPMSYLLQHTGDYGSSGPGCEDWSTLHLAQQSKQPVCEPEEGIQRHLLARRADPVLPVSLPSKGGHHGPKVLPRVGQAGEGKAR